MSQKHCSLALDETKIEEQVPKLKILVNKAYLRENHSFLQIKAASEKEEAVKIKGRMTVSF